MLLLCWLLNVVLIGHGNSQLLNKELLRQHRANVCSRSITEYLLPTSAQTHEISCVPRKNLLLITQLSNSTLVKARTTLTGEVTAVRGHVIGNSTSGLHGLWASTYYPGRYWVSLENDNKLILLDPKTHDITAAPLIIKTIAIPSPGDGPHHIAEYGVNMWATLKKSNHVLRINHVKPSQYKLYPALPIPVFLAQHPISKDIYASEFKSNTILRINPKTNAISRIAVPPRVGESPVGIVSNGNVSWVTLLSIQSNGTGSFGKIYSNGTVEWFRLKTAIGKRAALLHIAFDPTETTETRPGMWILGSSVESLEAYDMIIRTPFDANFEIFDREEIAVLPSQRIKAHRMSSSENGLYVTELTSSRVAFYKRTKSSNCDFTFQGVDGDEGDDEI